MTKTMIATILLLAAIMPSDTWTTRRDSSVSALTTRIQAGGRVLYVDNDESEGEGDGSRQSPFATIKAAAKVVQPGDRVEIAEGEYQDELNLSESGTAEAPIVFAAAPGAKVLIDEEIIVISGDYVILEGINVEGTGDDSRGGVFVTGGKGIILRDITARENDGAGLRIKPLQAPVVDLQVIGGSYTDNDGAGIAATGEKELRDLVIDGVTVHDNDGDGIQIERATDITIKDSTTTNNGEGDERNGLFLKQVTMARVNNLTTSDNGHDGLALRRVEDVVITRSVSTGNDHHGFDSIENSKNVSFINNVAFRNGDDPEDKGLYVTDTDGIRIENNIFAHNSGDQLAFSEEAGPVSNVTSNHNLFWREDGERLIRWFDQYFAELWEYQETSGLDEGSIVADPQFMEEDEGNFQLSLGSPAIDAGHFVEGITEDFSGDAPDVGAYERQEDI